MKHLLLPFLLLTMTSHAATFQVSSNLDDGSIGTFRWAISQSKFSSPGLDSIVFVAPPQTIIMTNFFEGIQDSTIFIGNGWTIDGNNNWPCLSTNGYVEVYDLRFANGFTSLQGEAIGAYANHQMIFDNCEFINNAANGYGGAVVRPNSFDGDLIFRNCLFSGNTSTSTTALGGGAIFASGSGLLLIHNCTFQNNSAPIGNAIQVSFSDIKFSGMITMGSNQDIHGFQMSEEYDLDPTFCAPLGFEFSVGN